MNGYKGMLRDRMPLMIDLALKYCKCKDEWINHCYNNFIRVVPQEDRSRTVKEMLGICKRPGCKRLLTQDDYIMLALYGYRRKDLPSIETDKLYYSFSETINWKELDEAGKTFWNSVCGIVNWFKTTYVYVENDYRISVIIGKSEESIKSEIKLRYKLSDNLLDYLLKCFKQYE